MYHSSCQSLPHPVACQSLRISSLRLPSIEVLLCVLKQGSTFSVTLSGPDIVSRLEVCEADLPTDKIPKADLLLATIRASSCLTVNPVASFDAAANILHHMHREKALEHDDYLEHLEMMTHYKDGLDVEGLETYFHLADLISLASQFKVYQVSERTREMWIACWGTMLKMAKSLL